MKNVDIRRAKRRHDKSEIRTHAPKSRHGFMDQVNLNRAPWTNSAILPILGEWSRFNL